MVLKTQESLTCVVMLTKSDEEDVINKIKGEQYERIQKI